MSHLRIDDTGNGNPPPKDPPKDDDSGEPGTAGKQPAEAPKA